MKFMRIVSMGPSLPESNPYFDIEFVSRKAEIKKGDEVLFSMDDVVVPKSWSQNAVDTLAHKYFRKADVPDRVIPVPEAGVPEWLWRSEPDLNAVFSHEQSLGQICHRIAGDWTYWGFKEGVFDDEESAKAFYDNICYMISHQIAAPNSPQWFNTGLYWAYGIKGTGSGHWYVDPETDKTVQATSAYVRPQTSACYIQHVDDDLVRLGGIMDLWRREALLFKYGSGTGTNFSSLRGNGEPMSGGGVSSGLMSWLKIGDRTAAAIKSGGTTRRAAKMVIVDADHPEIFDFVTWKSKEEVKVVDMISGYSAVRDLVSGLESAYAGNGNWNNDKSGVISTALSKNIPQGFVDKIASMLEQCSEIPYIKDVMNSDWQGEAYSTVSGQQSNNVVRVTDSFMNAVVNDETWNLTWRTDLDHSIPIKAKDLWEQICRSSWFCGDPGLQFDTTINNWHTTPAAGPIVASNPCSEFMAIDDTACNLLSINLVSFYKDAKFDYRLFSECARLCTVALEISVYMSQFPSEEIARNSYDYRFLGLGYANLGGLIMRMGLPYDSPEARKLAAEITAEMTGVAFIASADMSQSLGPFPKFKDNAFAFIDIMKKHRAEVVKMGLSDEARELWDTVVTAVSEYGARNAQVTLLAPTGTVSIVMDCDTSGIEPDFGLVKQKRLAGYGDMEIINSGVEEALFVLGYHSQDRHTICEYLREHGNLSSCQTLDSRDRPVFHCANDIKPLGHVLMMVAVQPFLSGSISKTVNMPAEATIQDVSDILMTSWKMGLKCVTIFRNNCKLSQPLSSGLKSKQVLVKAQVQAGNEALSRLSTRKKLPYLRRGHTQKAVIEEFKLFLHTGEYEDGSLGEIFIDISKEGSLLAALINAFCVAISIGLQYGVPLDKFVRLFTFSSFGPNGAVQGDDRIKNCTSIIDYVFRHLAVHYLKNEELAHVPSPDGPTLEDLTEEKEKKGGELKNKNYGYTGGICPECFSHKVVSNGTCTKCLNCGGTSGCS